MTTPPQPDKIASEEKPCCGGVEGSGQAGAWIPEPGEPQVIGCMLCKLSGRHWKDQPE